ncbi:MAG: hypothetical protein ACKVIN_16340, partial [Longimicrobiales bacterium]
MIRSLKPIDGLKEQGKIQPLLQLDDDGPFITPHRYDVARTDLAFHLIALSLEEPLDRLVEVDLSHGVSGSALVPPKGF